MLLIIIIIKIIIKVIIKAIEEVFNRKKNLFHYFIFDINSTKI